MKFKLVILRNENEEDHQLWVKACSERSEDIEYSVINLTRNDWYEKVINSEADFFIARPPGFTSLFKQLFDERIYIISAVLNLPVYPSLNEILIYENKRFLSYWLKANNLPHPETYVYYNKEEAFKALDYFSLPLVGKSNIGASGSGVKILENKLQVEEYIKLCFSDRGAPKRWGPNLSKGRIIKRGMHYLFNPGDIKKKINVYEYRKREVQNGFVILQNFIPHDFEWRVTAIGDSYFAHKKLKIGYKASGSTLKKYDNPPTILFDFAKGIMDRYGFYSEAIDLFQDKKGDFLINEIQCLFGQSDPYQMLVDGKPGRYRYLNEKWIFEEGYFNSNESYNMRIQHIIDLLENNLMNAV